MRTADLLAGAAAVVNGTAAETASASVLRLERQLRQLDGVEQRLVDQLLVLAWFDAA